MNRKMIPGVLFVAVLAVIVTSCGGGGGSGSNGINDDSTSVTPDTSGTPGLISWPFVNSYDYTYDTDKIQISDGTAHLVPVDQTDDDNTLTGFDGGIHDLTQWDANNNWLGLQTTQTTGYFISLIMDAGAATSWNAISWTPQGPYYNELPDNAQSETAYPEGNVDMTGNVLLLHMNETGWTGTANEVIDSSGSGNHGTSYNGANTTTGGKFGRAGNFNGTGGYVKVLDSDSLDITGPMTITAWIYPRTAGGSNQGGDSEQK